VQRVSRFIAALAAISAALAVSAAAAQNAPGAPGAFSSFSNNRDQPIHISAAALEVRDKEKRAVFRGAVKVVQGDTTLTCKTLDVFYEQGVGSAAREPEPGPQQQIKRLEAKGGVRVVQKDQSATGDNGIFDLRSNTITLVGNVVVTQGQNVLRGDRMVVDLTTGVSRVESSRTGESRVQGLFLPNSAKQDSAKQGATQGREAPKPLPRPAQSAPLRLN
jgi:lipopolysaccharide export system protein LptA